jgi:deoxyribodipyrimidine photo-lyase
MEGARRLGWNFTLQRAAGLAREYRRPLVILEPLRIGERWASDRFHRFVLDGMVEHAAALTDSKAVYYPFVERQKGETGDLLAALASRACVVVTDDYPCSSLPDTQQAMAKRLRTRLEVIDGNGLLPLRATDHVYSGAYHFRRFLQKCLPDALFSTPVRDPLQKALPRAGRDLVVAEAERWPAAAPDWLSSPDALNGIPIDHGIAPVPYRGGADAAERTLQTFLGERLHRYADERNHPDAQACSGLSPYLRFGHISVHQVFQALADREGWTHADLAEERHGKRSGWWGMSEEAEAFLDELVTWRELGFNMNGHRDDYDRYESLPEWARDTLEKHEADDRPRLYTLEQLDRAATYDPLWNAAQRELVLEGRVHGYLRMLWGKKILEWSPTARDALDAMIELNNRYATDGRDPNSYSGIFWVLGRYDRPWPERSVFGTVRSMTSESTRRKVPLKRYLERFGGGVGQGSLFSDAADER